MAKKLTAATDIKAGDTYINAGDPINPSDFTREQLKELYDAGAVKVDDEYTDAEVAAKPGVEPDAAKSEDPAAGTGPAEKTVGTPAPKTDAKATDAKK